MTRQKSLEGRRCPSAFPVVTGLLLCVAAATLPLDSRSSFEVQAAEAQATGPCMFDPRDSKYHRCAHASMGRCHHYAETCEPAGLCMFNPREGTYNRCAHASMGECRHYVETCEPPGACMFNPRDRTYHRCAHVSMGRCHHYAELCEPPPGTGRRRSMGARRQATAPIEPTTRPR